MVNAEKISPKLSVLMTNYNHAKYIAGALKSIATQSFKPYEVIVCDDGSTDNSVEIIQEFVDKYEFIRLIRNDVNLGIFASFDKLTAVVSGDYVYCASADDNILPGFFEKSMNLMQQHPQAAICTTLSFATDKDKDNRKLCLAPIPSFKQCYFSPERVRDIFVKQGCWIFGITVILRADYFKNEGYRKKELYSFSDCFIDHVLALKHGACFIPEPLTSWRKTDGASYSDKITNCPQTYGSLIEETANLMRTSYAGLFPSEYIEKWKRQHLFYKRANILKNRHNQKLTSLHSFLASFGKLGKLLFFFLKMLLKTKASIEKLYLFIFFKGSIKELIAQRAKFYFYIWNLSKSQKKGCYGKQ